MSDRPSELLPCPWCGSELESTSVSEGSTFRWRKVDGCCTDGPEVRHDTLSKDQVAAEAESRAKAIAAWNTRARAIDAAAPQPATASTVVRHNDDGTLDEVVGTGEFHLEQMGPCHWWMQLGPHMVHLQSRGKIKAAFGENEARDPSPDVTSQPATAGQPTTDSADSGSKSVVPTAEHWRRAIADIFGPDMPATVEQRAVALAREEGK